MQITKSTTVTLQLLPDETISVKVGAWQVDAFRLDWRTQSDLVEVHGMQIGYVRAGVIQLNALPFGIIELLREEAKK